MSDAETEKWPGAGGIGRRTRALYQAVKDAPSELDATIGLPDHIEPGTFGFTYMADLWGGPQAQEIHIDWGGGLTATWTEDMSPHEGITPGSGALTRGWASWLNGRDLLLAYSNPEAEFEGWARVPGGAPTADADGDMEHELLLADPKRWLRFAKTISEAIGAQGTEGTTGQQYGIEAD